MDKYLFGVNSSKHSQLLTVMDEVEGVLEEVLGFDSQSVSQYYEFQARFQVKGTKSPVAAWASQMEGHPLFESISELLDRSVSPYGIRFAPSGEPPNQIDWFEVRVEPYVGDGENLHQLQCVYRKSSRDNVFNFISSFDELIISILRAVEG